MIRISYVKVMREYNGDEVVLIGAKSTCEYWGEWVTGKISDKRRPTSSGYVTNKTGSSWSSTDRVISMLVGMIVPVKGLRHYVERNRFTENWVTEWLVAEHLRLGRPRYRKRKQNSFQHHGGKCKSPSKFAWKREWVEEMGSMGVIKNGMKMLQTKWDDAWCTAVSFYELYSRIFVSVSSSGEWILLFSFHSLSNKSTVITERICNQPIIKHENIAMEQSNQRKHPKKVLRTLEAKGD